jgi:hypothetical protein
MLFRKDSVQCPCQEAGMKLTERRLLDDFAMTSNDFRMTVVIFELLEGTGFLTKVSAGETS